MPRSSRSSTILLATALFILVVPSHVFAATVFLVPQQRVVGPKDTLIVDVRVDSAGAGFNAAQATIRFPKSLLLAAEPDTKNSAFSFWLEQPTASNDQGVVSFTGGTPYGVSGSSIQILRLTFTPKGVGSGTISVVDAAVTASDGSGTNILSTTTDTTITVSPTRVAPAGVSAVPTIATSTTAAAPRVPVAGSDLPSLPVVRIPLYPESTAWYDAVSPFTVNWNLPPDVSEVNTVINTQPNFIPSGQSKGLFDSESFNALTDGVWYLHVRFRNSVGWGPTLHRRIAIDTVPPINFKISRIGTADPTTPASTLQFKTNDALSGLQGYVVRIDNASLPLITAAKFSGSFTTPPLVPGTHHLSVQALDLAGNSVISTTSVQIEPIAAPSIISIPSSIYTHAGQNLTVQGTAQPNYTLLVSIYQDGSVIEQGAATATAGGDWTFTASKELPLGTFIVHVRSQDARGAQSEEVLSSPVYVEEKPIIQFGALHLGMQGAIIALLLIICSSVALGWRLYRTRQDLLFMRLLSAETDLAKVFALTRNDLNLLKKTCNESESMKLILDRLYENNEKMESYLRREIQNINK